MFYYKWTARFADGGTIVQPDDDRYSKHDDTKEHNPSAFRDILDRVETVPLRGLELKSVDGNHTHFVDVMMGMFYANGVYYSLERPGEVLENRKLIYFRTMESTNKNPEPRVVAYNFGYEGKDVESGKIVEKVVTLYE